MENLQPVEEEKCAENSAKPPSYLKSLGLGELRENSVADRDSKGTHPLSEDHLKSEVMSLCHVEESPALPPKGNWGTPIDQDQLYSSSTYLQTNEKQQFKSTLFTAIQDIAPGDNGPLEGTTGAAEGSCLPSDLPFFSPANMESQTQESFMNTSALSVLLRLTQNKEIPTSFSLNQSQIREILSTSVNENALIESLMRCLLAHVDYLEETIKAYVCWNDVMAVLLKLTTEKAKRWKSVIRSGVGSSEALQKTREIDKSLNGHLYGRLDFILTSKSQASAYFNRKMATLLRVLGTGGLVEAHQVLSQHPFFVKNAKLFAKKR
jgi:hypothetical protein